jgi:capsular polysaccharide biosynthesis protein
MRVRAGRGLSMEEVNPAHGGWRREREWKTQIGRLTFFNAERRMAREMVRELAVAPEPMDVQIVHDAFILRGSRVGNSPRGERHIARGIYNSQGAIVPGVVQRGPPHEVIETPTAVDSAQVASAERLTGTSVYLGILRPHFGHFLLETMSRAWYLVNLDTKVRIVLHSDRVDNQEIEVRNYFQTMLQALSIDPQRLLIANRDLRVEELIIPTPQFWLRSKASPGFCLVFDRVREKLSRQGYPGGDFPNKVYLTRRQYDSIFGHRVRQPGISDAKLRRLNSKLRRTPSNEREVEAVFAARGFDIVAPETLPFEQQIMLIGNATHIAGRAGSAMHMILFNNKPDAKVIELTARNIPNQILVEGARGIKAYHIFCREEDDQRFMLDLALIERALDEIL